MTRAVAKPHSARQRGRGEFMLYFYVIFAFSLVFSTAGWVADVIRQKTLDLQNPIARAWSSADQITPMIFSV